METRKRMSMNTSLRDARIFDEELTDEFMLDVKNIKQDYDPVPDTNFSIDTEQFKNIKIKKEDLDELTSPMKVEPYDNSDSNSRKSFKSSRVSSYKKRDSPYKTMVERLGPSTTSETHVTNLNFDDKSQDCRPKKSSRNVELETDAEVLSRRQKQIDYGKNTVGYDEYSRAVPRGERKQDDPQTPNKNLKYSRRGWDGLIKQWRLKLHKYDPEDAA